MIETYRMIAEAWNLAAHDLGIQVIAPFSLTVAEREHQYLALVPHFGGGKGTVVAALPSDRVLYANANGAGYRCSFVNVELYCTYQRAFFVDTLTEWGFTGPEERRPPWLAHATAS